MNLDPYRRIYENDDDDFALFAVSMGGARAIELGYDVLREEYFARLPMATARRVLAVGCGSGFEVRELRHLPSFRGTVIGLDQSPLLVRFARSWSAHEGLDSVDYVAGYAEALPFPDAAFDIVLAHQVLGHVADPAAAVREAARVTAPGGTFAVFDADHASLRFAYPDDGVRRRVEEALPRFVTHPRVMRELPGLLGAAGLAIVGRWANVYSDGEELRGFGIYQDFGDGRSRLTSNLAVIWSTRLYRAGLLTEDEFTRWRAHESICVGTCTYWTYLARRPATD